MTSRLHIGIDVAKDELVIAFSDNRPVLTLENALRPIRQWVKSLPEACSIAIEPTSKMHCQVLTQLHAAGHRVYLVDGYQVSNYRKSVRQRAKTDPLDAQLLLRFLLSEEPELTPWAPPPAVYEQLRSALQRRSRLVKARTMLRQSFEALGELQDLKSIMRSFARLIARLDREIQRVLMSAQLTEQSQRCQQVPGIGPLTAAGLICSSLRGEFRKSDAFIAFLGLDVAARDSGRKQGRRTLTKQGNAEVRRLLYCSAMTACRHPDWLDFYQRHLDRGLTRIQALVALGRKLARVVFAIIRSGQPYKPHRESASMT